jgi:hypothetical protein
MEGAEAAKRRQEQLEKEVREYHERGESFLIKLTRFSLLAC